MHTSKHARKIKCTERERKNGIEREGLRARERQGVKERNAMLANSRRMRGIIQMNTGGKQDINEQIKNKSKTTDKNICILLISSNAIIIGLIKRSLARDEQQAHISMIYALQDKTVQQQKVEEAK